MAAIDKNKFTFVELDSYDQKSLMPLLTLIGNLYLDNFSHVNQLF